MTERKTIIEYEGRLTFSTISQLITSLKYKSTDIQMKTGVYKRLLSVIIEALENIYKYNDNFSGKENLIENHPPHFKLVKNQVNYYIETRNAIWNKDIEKLKKKIDLVNSKSLDELKLYYRQTITNGKFTDKGGAGLGIIEMVKISGNSLDYQFEEISPELSLYHLSITF